MEKRRIVNVVVTYNRSSALRKTLDHLVTGGFSDVILVDNASTDDTQSIIVEFREKFERLVIIRLERNTGGSGGFHAGLSYFIKNYDDASFCILHDDDSWPLFKFSDLRTYLDPNVYMGCFPVIHPDGQLVRMNRPGAMSLLTKPFSPSSYMTERRPKVMGDFDRFDSFDYASFVGLIIKRDALIRVGLPSPRFFIYSDDTFFTAYASQTMGIKIANLHKGVLSFAHDCNRSTGRSLLNSRFTIYEVRNKIIFLRQFSKIWVLHVVYFLLKSIILAPKKFGLIFKGACEGLKGDLKHYQPSLDH